MALCLLASGGTSNAGGEPGGELMLIYSGNLDGELEPCGCTAEGDLGGIKRRVTLMDAWRTEGLSPVLISTGGLFRIDLPADRITNRFILSGMAALDYDAIGVQWTDLTYGADFLRDSHLPFVASNWQGRNVAAKRVIERDGVRVVYFHWLPPEASPYQGMKGEHRRADADTSGLAKSLADAKRSGSLTVLGTTLTPETAARRLPLDDVDILIAQSQFEQFAAPRRMGNTLILRPGSRGQRLGRLNLRLDALGMIADWRHHVVAMPDGVPDAPRMTQWYDAYNEALRVDYGKRVALKKKAATTQSPYAGGETCQQCHPKAWAAWQSSRHAKALDALEDVGKSFDANCVGCHSVGFERPGGFIDNELTAHLQHVRCESCHGPAREHVESGGSTRFEPQMARPVTVCQQCHNRAHSPSFNYREYWPKIQHGKEMIPPAGG
ncbi:MAG: hypothetical protein DRQ37_05370 [Gammaproteobacteria bacterium]|nr:MAG: hypothetical protein DRQ37_05370 [Gammaproteobacteria bacterium]